MIRNDSVIWCISLLGLTCLLPFAPAVAADMETNTYQLTDQQTVLLLERTGRYEEAEARCKQVLQLYPDNLEYKRLLAGIEVAKHDPHSSKALRETLDEIIIPEVNFRGAGVAGVIDFLQAESQKISGADTPINFVWQAPENFKAAKITLNLRSVPLADVLKYVTESAGLRYRVDPRAVVIYQAPPESSPPNVKFP